MVRRQTLFLALLISFLILGILFVSPLVAAGVPDSPTARLNESWQLATEHGTFRYNTSIEQTTRPQLTLKNVGLGSQIEQIYIDGAIDRLAETMHMKLWSQNGSVMAGQGALEMKVEEGITYGRKNHEAWQKVETNTDLFAPGGDPLGFLNAAVNITHVGDEQGAPVRYTRYRYTIDGPAFASYMHKKLTAIINSR